MGESSGLLKEALDDPLSLAERTPSELLDRGESVRRGESFRRGESVAAAAAAALAAGDCDPLERGVSVPFERFRLALDRGDSLPLIRGESLLRRRGESLLLLLGDPDDLLRKRENETPSRKFQTLFMPD